MGELNRVPVWKTLMGLKDGEDVGVLAGTPGLRAGLRKLFLEVERMMREELGAAGKKKGKYTTLKYDEWAKPFTLTKKFCFQEFLKREAAQQQKIEEKGEEKVEVKVEEKLEVLEEAQKEVVTEVKAEVKVDLQELERTYMWDPVRSVCLRLEIAQSKLSYLSKMYSGKSALEIADCIKAEGLKVYFWEHARNFVLTAHGSARAAFFDQKAWEKCYLQKRSFTGELIPVVGELDPEEIFAKNDPYSNWQEGLPALK